MLSATKAMASRDSALRISVTISIPPPNLSIIPLKKRKIAVISLYNSGPQVPPSTFDIPGFSGGYRVEESLPVAYARTWNDLVPTPGICLLTLFRKKKAISRETFLDRWHNGHTPLSIRIHPLWHYNRNVVLEKLTPTTEDFDGIVEEHFRERADLLNPLKFFGKPSNVVQNMMAVYKDINRFLEFKSIESYLMREYHIQS